MLERSLLPYLPLRQPASGGREVGNKQLGPLGLVGRIEWYQELDEALFHLTVGKSQLVELELLVVAVDGQVAALIEQGQGGVRP